MKQLTNTLGQNIAIIGTQWGDEGKGKLVDAITKEFDIVCRSAGGANAGHTIVVDGTQYIFHSLPSSMLHPNVIGVIGNGTVISITDLIEELDELKESGLDVKDRIKIAINAHLIFDYHKEIDKELEIRKGSNKIGTTHRGIGPAYTDKVSRIGIRCEDLFDKELLATKIKDNCEFHNKNLGLNLNAEEELNKVLPHIETIKPLITNTRKYLQDANKAGKKILFEGAQGVQLDVDYGTYPFVTSSSTSIGGVLTGLGVGPHTVSSVVGIAKAYTTRVGSGPFPSELENELGESIRQTGHEFGATTGRPRRCGWFDAVIVKSSVMANDIDAINLTKLDILSDLDEIEVVTQYFLDDTELFTVPTTTKALKKLKLKTKKFPGWKKDISGIQKFEDLPKNAQDYVLALEELIEAPIKFIGTGADRNDLIFR